jgi:putative membrane protein
MWNHGFGWDMMGGGGLMGGFGWVLWIAILVAIIAALVWLIRSQPLANSSRSPAEGRSPGVDVLEERYARGEINREEYLQKKKDIGS